MIVAKYLTSYAFFKLSIEMVDYINVVLLLDVFELLVTLYALYSLHVFALCLSQSSIKEYQPLHKFYWFAFLTFALVIQPFLLQLAIEVSTYDTESENSNDDKQESTGVHHATHALAMKVNSVVQAAELVLFLLGMKIHFLIRPQQDNKVPNDN